MMKDNVLRGIELLDRQVPDWRDRIDWERLDTGTCTLCIMGQLFGDYSDGLKRLDLSYEASFGFGFNVQGTFDQLTELWRQAARGGGEEAQQ